MVQYLGLQTRWDLKRGIFKKIFGQDFYKGFTWRVTSWIFLMPRKMELALNL